MMVRIIVILLALSVALSSVAAVKTKTAPFGSGIMANGKNGPQEWQFRDVLRFVTDNRLDIRVKQSNFYVYIAIIDLDTTHTGIDLYIENPDSSRKLLHISTACGEKDFKDGQWSDFRWGENTLWSGNVVQSIVSDGKTEFLAPDIFEFQISKQLITGKEFKMMIDLKRPGKTGPADASPDDSENWLVAKLRI